MFLDQENLETKKMMISQSKFHTCHLIPVLVYSSNILGLLKQSLEFLNVTFFLTYTMICTNNLT